MTAQSVSKSEPKCKMTRRHFTFVLAFLATMASSYLLHTHLAHSLHPVASRPLADQKDGFISRQHVQRSTFHETTAGTTRASRQTSPLSSLRAPGQSNHTEGKDNSTAEARGSTSGADQCRGPVGLPQATPNRLFDLTRYVSRLRCLPLSAVCLRSLQGSNGMCGEGWLGDGLTVHSGWKQLVQFWEGVVWPTGLTARDIETA